MVTQSWELCAFLCPEYTTFDNSGWKDWSNWGGVMTYCLKRASWSLVVGMLELREQNNDSAEGVKKTKHLSRICGGWHHHCQFICFSAVKCWLGSEGRCLSILHYEKPKVGGINVATRLFQILSLPSSYWVTSQKICLIMWLHFYIIICRKQLFPSAGKTQWSVFVIK